MKAKLFKILLLILALSLLLCGCGQGAFETAYSVDGLVVKVITDKDAYVGTETAKVDMQIINNTGKEIAVSADVKTPDGLAVDLETLGGNFKAEPGKIVTLYDIGIKLNPLGLILWIVGGVLLAAGAAVAVIVIIRKGKAKNAIAMILCICVLGGLAASIQPLEAEASVYDVEHEAVADYTGQMTVQHPVIVDGVKVNIEAVLDYEIGLPVEPVYEPLVEETDYVDPDSKKPNGKVLAWYYNDFDGDHAMYDKGANVKLSENSMELAGTQEQGYLRTEITNAATSSYQADFRDSSLVDNFVVHFKVSTENQIPNGTYMLYRYKSSGNKELFRFKDGYLYINGKSYNQLVAGEWMEIDMVFDLTPEANDQVTFYVNGQYLLNMTLPKHEELYKIPYMRWHIIGDQTTIGSTMLLDDFMVYPGKDILSIDQVNTPNYPYYQQHTVAPDVAIDHPELSDLGDQVVAVLAGSDQAYVNGEVITMSAAATDRSSGDVFTDAAVPGSFLKKYLGVTDVADTEMYSLLQYATGKNIVVDSRGLIILTDDVVLDVDSIESTDIRIVTLLYGYLATGKLVNNYAVMPALDQDMVDKAVHNTEIYPTQVALRSYDAMATDVALYYLVLAARMDPDRTSTDGISVEAEAVRRLKNMVAGGNEPMAAVGNSWEHGVVSSALTLARFTPNLWNQLTKEEQEKVDLLMECLAIAANWGYNLDNNYITPFDLRGSFAKNLNPNFLFAYITCYFNASMYFGAEELDEIFVNFSHAEYVERLTKAGFTNILYQWTIKDNLGLDIGYYMENGGEVLLLGDDAVIANGSAGSSLKAGETGGTGVGVKVPFKYEGLLSRKVYDSNQLLEMFMDTLSLNYCWKVMSSNQAPGTMYYAYILTMVQSPWEGQMGMMRELSVGDDRSKIRYSWLSAINIAPLLSNFKLLGYWDYDANPELTQRMLELENRVYVGTEDLFFKMHQGYLGCSQRKQVEELDSGFVNEGADLIEDIFMNFLFMKNQDIVYDQPTVAQDLLPAAEPMNGVTEPPEGAVSTIARDPSNNYAWDLWSPLNPGTGYTSGDMSFDIVIEDQLVDSGFKSYIVIDKKVPGKGYTESPMLFYFDQLTGISVLDKSQFMPLGIFFGANYRFHVNMKFDCASRTYSGTITQTWPETEKPITATFNNGFRTTATMSWTFVDSMVATTHTGYRLLWVENIQVEGNTLTPPALELTEEVTVNMDMSGLPTWARPAELKVNLAIGDWVSPRTVSFTAEDGWSSKVFDNLPKEIGSLPVNWTVQMLQKVPGYYATVNKTGDNNFTITWSDTKYFYDNNFEVWNKGEYVAKNTLIYDARGNGLRDYNDKASWGELTRGTEASGNDYLKIGGTKAAQATFALDSGAEAGIYVFKMRLKLEKAEDMITATHFAYRYLKGEQNVKNTFINIEKNRLEVGGYVLGTLTADEWMDIMVMLDFKTGVGEVFYDDPGYRRTFELDPISTSAITLFSTNNNGVLCIDDLQVYTCSRLSVIKPPDEANKKAELIIPETPIPELDPAYKWYYNADFEYWNKGNYVAGNTPIKDAYGNTMIDQWSNSYGPLVRSGDETGNHFLELNSYKTMQAQLFVDPEFDDGTYIMKWRMKLKDENSVVSSVVFSYRREGNKKVDFATITEKAVKVCGKSLGKLTADEWMEVMVVLDFNTSTATLCDWEGHAIATMALKPIGGRMFNIFANGGTKGLCIDDLQLYSGSVTILDPLPGQPGDEEDPDAPADVAFESNFDAALPTEPDGEAYTYLVDANGNKLSVTNGAYSVNDGYLAVSGSEENYNYLFFAEGTADILNISFKVRLPDAETTIPGKSSTGIALRTYKNDADIAKFYGQNFRINGKSYALSADQWLEVSIQVDYAADKVTYTVGGESGEFEFTGIYNRLELFALAKGEFTLHFDDLRISNEKHEEDVWTGTLETTVVWNDSADDDGIRPEGVYVSLYNGLNLIGRKEATAATGWKCSFTELSQYDPEGNPIGYTVVVTSEDVPEGYEVAIAGATVTLTHTPETTYYYNNDFENNDLQGTGGETEIADNNNRILTDFNGYFLTHVDAETGNTFLELADETAAQAASSRMTFAAGPIQVSFRVRLAEGVEDIGTSLRLRTAKNGWFAAFSGKNLVVNDGEGTSFTLGEEWIDVTFIIEPESKVTYQIGDAAPVQFAYTAACGRFEIFNNSGDAYSGLYMDDLQISVYEAPEVDPEEPTEPGEAETEAPTEPTEAPTEPTEAPTEPTEAPTEPTEAPTEPTEAPTEPTEAPTEPTEAPTEPTEAPTEPTEAPTEPETEAPTEAPTEPDATYFYNNDFDNGTQEDRNFLDKSGNVLANSTGYFTTHVDELTGNKYLEIAGSAKATDATISSVSGKICISFRICIADDVAWPNNLRFRTTSGGWFVAITSAGLSTPDGKTFALTADWLEVSVTIDPETDKLIYQIGDQSGEYNSYTEDVDSFGIYNYKAATYSGLYIDDLKIESCVERVEEVSLDVAVAWEDGGNNDEIRPESVFVSVYNGLNLVKREEVTAANNWQHTFTELPKLDAEGNEIGYTVLVSSSDLPEGYTAAVNGADITLSHTPEITWYYNSDFESTALTGAGAAIDIPDASETRVFKDLHGGFVTRQEEGNKFLELKDSVAAQEATARTSGSTTVTYISFRVKLAPEVTNIGSTLRMRTTNKGWFAAFSGKNILLGDDSTTSFELTDQWLDVYFVIEANTKVTYKIGDVTGEYAYTRDGGRFEIYNNSGAAFSGLYIDDLKVYTK